MQTAYLTFFQAALLAAGLSACLPAEHGSPATEAPTTADPQPAYPNLPPPPTDRRENAVERLVREYPGDRHIQTACRKAAPLDLARIGITPDVPAYSDSYQESLQAAEQMCVRSLIMVRVAALLEYINLHTNVEALDPTHPQLTLPTTQDYPFLQSATQHGNEVEFVFNDLIPQLSGQKLVLLVSVEVFKQEDWPFSEFRGPIPYPDGAKRLVFNDSPKTTMSPLFLLIPDKFLPI